MNQETNDNIKRHFERQLEAHGAAFLLAQTNPQLAKLYGKYWQAIHAVIAVATFFAVSDESKAAMPRLVPG